MIPLRDTLLFLDLGLQSAQLLFRHGVLHFDSCCSGWWAEWIRFWRYKTDGRNVYF
jgi:hypothetical protein